MSAAEYWDGEFSDNLAHHSSQNGAIAQSFFGLISGRNTGLGYVRFRHALLAERIIEVGCGTGEFCGLISWAFRTPTLVGVDISPQAVAAARRRYPFLTFGVWDVTLAPPSWAAAPWDLAVCSNVLEHFQDPHAVMARLFSFAARVLALVPYRQPVTDGYDCEGGAGHVYTFTKKTFDRYDLEESVVFESPGWQWSAKGEKPLQLAVLVRPK